MPLTVADTGEEYVIKRIGGKPEVKQHLENLGFVVGGVVSVINTHERQRHRQGQGIPRGHQRGNGAEDHGLSARYF